MPDLSPANEPTDRIDVVVVPEGEMAGTWIRDDQRLTTRAEQRLMEIIVGRQRIIERAAGCNTYMQFGAIRSANREHWAKVIGLVFVGLATRVTM